MLAKMARSAPSAAVRSVNGDDSRPRRQPGLPKRGENAKIRGGSKFIRRIPVERTKRDRPTSAIGAGAKECPAKGGALGGAITGRAGAIWGMGSGRCTVNSIPWAHPGQGAPYVAKLGARLRATARRFWERARIAAHGRRAATRTLCC